LLSTRQPCSTLFPYTTLFRSIGCGMGTDGAQFARAGADYTGIDLTEAAIDLARARFALSGLKGDFRVNDAENLDFPDDSFDLVRSEEHTSELQSRFDLVCRLL